MVVGILASAAGGSAAAYGTYAAACGDDPCLGGALGGFGVNLAVTPLIAYGVGRLMGGEGLLSTTYLGALMGFAVGAPFAGQGNVGLVIGVISMPILAPLAFELSSDNHAGQMGGVRLAPYVARVRRSDGLAMTTAGWAGTF